MLDRFLGGIREKVVMHGVGEEIAWARAHYLFVQSGFSSHIYRLRTHFQTFRFFIIFSLFFPLFLLCAACSRRLLSFVLPIDHFWHVNLFFFWLSHPAGKSLSYLIAQCFQAFEALAASKSVDSVRKCNTPLPCLSSEKYKLFPLC